MQRSTKAGGMVEAGELGFQGWPELPKTLSPKNKTRKEERKALRSRIESSRCG